MARKKRFWYVEPKNDGHTNGVFWEQLGEAAYLGEIRCADGRKHRLYSCPETKLISFWANRDTKSLAFQVFLGTSPSTEDDIRPVNIRVVVRAFNEQAPTA